ncbi:MlaD family protein [Geofilum rubicundum]|uniref:ABC transporter, permease component n=1 Tax=Geofilum rubicundum JCM 15548 TaxID=1236989 RepID=A0A0E9M1M9_9BACT|nr:MlaD family protein [Geofilum rubicundum]GAO31463.1 ABC transporter, permease component [Geofilum rubicundum JCM 15548]
MDTHSQNFKVRLGLFIAGGLTIFVIAIFIIGKQQNLFNPVFKVTTNFFNVSGLQVGNNVRFSGINVGTVDNIKIINDSTVQVDLLIRKNVQQFIKSDSEATITSEGIIGDRVVMVTQGTFEAPMARDGQIISSIEPIETDAIIASLQSSSADAEVITRQLAEIMVNINTGQGVIGRLIQDSTMAENINLTIANLKKSSEGIDETIEMTRVNLFEFMEKLQLTVATTETATVALGEIMTKINSGEETLGMLIQDTTVSNTLNRTLINLEQSSEKLDENMEALQHNFLFRRYFRKKAEGKIEDKEADQEAAQE